MSRQFVKASSTIQMLYAFEAKLAEMEGTDVESATDVRCTADLQLLHEDGYDNYIDTDGSYTGVPGSSVSLFELKNYWNDFYNDDPLLNEEYLPEEGERWLADTLSHMQKVVEESTDIDASTDEISDELEPVSGQEDATDDIFMLMEYSSGDRESGMEGDDFYCYGKFFATDEADANRQLEEAKSKYAGTNWNLDDVYVTSYNDYFDDGEEVYQNLDVLLGRSVDYEDNVYDEIPFMD